MKSASGAAPSTVDEYIRQFPRDVQKKLADLRSTIRRAAPDAVEKIAYRMPTFFQKKNLSLSQQRSYHRIKNAYLSEKVFVISLVANISSLLLLLYWVITSASILQMFFGKNS